MNSSHIHGGIKDDKTLCLSYYLNIWRIKARGRSISCADLQQLCQDAKLLNPGSERKSKSASVEWTEWTQPCSNHQSLNHILNRLQDRRKSVLEDSFTMANKNWKSQIWIREAFIKKKKDDICHLGSDPPPPPPKMMNYFLFFFYY